MALFGFGKDRKEAGAVSESVLAYLEEAQRTRAPFTLAGPRRTEVQATLLGIDEAAGTLHFQAAAVPPVDKGARVEFLFIQDGLRVGGSGTVADVRATQVLVGLPEALELKERRSQPRARLNPKEGATLTALTGLFEGVGITGVVENLSEGGARVRVEKALNLKGEKRLPLSAILVPAGQPFMLVKLNHVAQVPGGSWNWRVGRCSWTRMPAAWSWASPSIHPRVDVATALRGLVASRTVPSRRPCRPRPGATRSGSGRTRAGRRRPRRRRPGGRPRRGPRGPTLPPEPRPADPAPLRDSHRRPLPPGGRPRRRPPAMKTIPYAPAASVPGRWWPWPGPPACADR